MDGSLEIMLGVEIISMESTDLSQEGLIIGLVGRKPVHDVKEVLLEEGLNFVGVLLLAELE